MHSITYRKTQDGQWVVFGPAGQVRLGRIAVSKKDGTTKIETVERVGKPFNANGQQMVYGYLAAPASYPRTSRSYAPNGRYECGECGDYVVRGTTCWETGMQH